VQSLQSRDLLSSLSSRRAALLAGTLLAGFPRDQSASAAVPRPPEGDCPECVGVISDLLNSCPAESEACVSSQNDDEAHFCAPWAYGGDRKAAMEFFAATVIGNPSSIDPVGYKKGGGRGVKPGRDQGTANDLSVVTELVKYDTETGYARVAIQICPKKYLDKQDENGSSSTQTFDLELLLWDDDEVVNVRCAARDRPTAKQGSWSLSYVDGFSFSKNTARDVAESVRVALGWELLPVISQFDPRFNNSKRLWFEKALDFGGFDASVMDERQGRQGKK
tara:strand:+ start:2763 stop:3596 length:834 start_codon:yes stop_codon:yes gene_type:complete